MVFQEAFQFFYLLLPLLNQLFGFANEIDFESHERLGSEVILAC